MGKYFIAIFIVLLGLGIVIGDRVSVFAQGTQVDEFTLEEITVTAQKREENQQKVAIVMEVISGDEIRELGHNDIDEIISNLSGVFVNQAPDGMRVSIRGMSDDINPQGPLRTLTTSTPTVAVNIDGTATSRRASGSGLFDLERVEVLYGPQSTLYTSNSPGGIVNIVTVDPNTEKYEAIGSIQYGNYNTMRTQGALNAPISDKMAVRAAFTTSVHDGYMSNGSSDEDLKASRLKFLYKPSEEYSFLVTGEYSKSGGHGYSGIDMFKNEGDLPDPWDNSDTIIGTPRDENLKKITGHFDWNLGPGVLSIVPAFIKNSMYASMTGEDFWSGQVTTTLMSGSGEEKSIELRMVSHEDSFLTWIFGTNYYSVYQKQGSLPIETGAFQDRENEQIAKAIYGNITYPMDKWRFTVGLRYSWDENKTGFYALMINPITHLPDPVETQTKSTYSNPNYKLGVEYDLGPDSMLYANWSTSYRLMGMITQDAEPELLNAFVIGSKNRFFGNRLQLNYSGYFYDYKNYLADLPMTSPDTGRMDPGSETPGDLRTIGADMQISAIISPKDMLDFSISYMDSEFAHLFFDYESEAIMDLEYTRKPQTFTPEWTFSASYSHNFNLANGGVLTARIDSKYQSKFLVTFAESYGVQMFVPNVIPDWKLDLRGHNTQEAHQISNFNLIYAPPDGKWTLSGYIKNIENYAEKKNLMQNIMNIGPPRTYGAVLSLKY